VEADFDQLWKWALDDAQLSPETVAVVQVTSPDDPEFGGRYMPPGDRSLTGVEPAAIELASEHASQSRVLVPTNPPFDGGAAGLLAMMRFQLQFARAVEADRNAYILSLNVDAALGPVFGDKGKGGGLIWNTIPLMRSANDAAGPLVTAKLGPQVGRLGHPFYGPLFRLLREPLPLDQVPKQSIVFAAIWPDAFEARTASGGTTASAYLDSLYPGASSWWDVLLRNELFRSLSHSAEAFTPTPEEIQRAPLPQDAWRPLEGLIDRAMRQGLAVLE
jgi:hypothetical protein